VDPEDRFSYIKWDKFLDPNPQAREKLSRYGKGDLWRQVLRDFCVVGKDSCKHEFVSVLKRRKTQCGK
jgi:hypothetical protein